MTFLQAGSDSFRSSVSVLFKEPHHSTSILILPLVVDCIGVSDSEIRHVTSIIREMAFRGEYVQ